jgi:hypothetical protein
MKIYFMPIGWLLLAASSASAQCNCNSSGTVPFNEGVSSLVVLRKNTWVTELYGDSRTFNNAHSEHNHSHHDHTAENNPAAASQNRYSVLAGIRYGISNRITLSVLQPYVWIVASPTRSNGMGDLLFSIAGKIVASKKISIGAVSGVKVPTGIRSSTHSDNNMAIGSGSFDPVVGLFITQSWQQSFLRVRCDLKYGTVGFNETNLGNTASGMISYFKKLKRKAAACNADSLSNQTHPLSWALFGSLMGEHYSHQTIEKVVVGNSGGYLVLASMGAQLEVKKWRIPITFGIPIKQFWYSKEAKTKFRIQLGVIKSI